MNTNPTINISKNGYVLIPPTGAGARPSREALARLGRVLFAYRKGDDGWPRACVEEAGSASPAEGTGGPTPAAGSSALLAVDRALARSVVEQGK